MRIVMFADRFFPYVGGVEKHTFELSKELIKKGHEITIITRNDEYGNLKKKEEYQGIKIIRINFNCRVIKFNIFKCLLREINTLLKADIIHFHDFSTFYYWYKPFKYIIPWKKTYVTFHGWEGVMPPEENVKKKRKKTENLTLGNICIGEFIEKWYNTKASKIIYGAAQINESYNFDEKKECIVYLGRIEPDTGILLYVEILIILKNKYNIQIPFQICGEGSLKEEVKYILEENNIEHKFEGMVKKPEEYLKYSKYCFTSGYLSIIEAMVNSNLVISVYNNELKKDYLKFMPVSEMMIIEEEISKCCSKIASVIKNKQEMNNRILKAYEWAKEQTWTKVANEYIELWEDQKEYNK